MRFVLRGLTWGALGYLGGGPGLAALVRWLGGPAWRLETVLTVGYPFALAGWLAGIGLWDAWARGWFGLAVRPVHAPGWRRYFTFCTDHKVIGLQYLVTFVGLFLLAGAMALLMRVELAWPGRSVVGPAAFNQIMSLHGIVMIAVAVAVVLGGLGNYLVPLMIGAPDMAFPRVNALSYWLVPPVALLLLGAQLVGGFNTGWTAYPPLSEINPAGQALFILAVVTFGLSSILGGINFVVTIARLRAPGMTWGRLPIFVWSVFAASLLSFTFTQYLAAALLMVLLDRQVGMAFFHFARQGTPLLYQHVFWFYSHPAVYIMILPAFGVALEVIAHSARTPLYAYRWAVGGFLGIVGLSPLVWAHHMFTSGMREGLHAPFLVTTEAISVPTGLVFLSALGTLWRGRLWLRTPMLFAGVGFLWNFLIGGLTGIFNADVATDLHLHDTYFVVSHFHYTIVGGEIFALFAALYYWFPKLTGRMYHERLGRLHFWWIFLAYNATFLPMFWLGLHGMNRRIGDYPPALAGVNLFVSVAAFLLGAGVLAAVASLGQAWVRGQRAAANPWQATTLEWQVPSPPPEHNFPAPPQVVGPPYPYGQPGLRHAVMPAAGGDR
ncbi:MAG: cbb3-type cytochrome c oxidase subunit I [Armatimonadota bacterium]|nr:cbb3-type cytochrome c oxidase subunit I [Armatimonadota bacterium]